MNMPSNAEFPVVCTIVLAFGKTDELIQCLESLRAQTGVEQQIAIVQNGAPESLLDRVAESYPKVHLIRNGGNAGAAAGRNVGITWAESFHPNYLFFMDNDATLEPDALEELVNAARTDLHAGFLGCVFYRKYEPTVVFTAGAMMRPPLFDEHIYHIDANLPWYEVDFVGTAAMLVPFGVTSSIGNFDEGLFVVDEDTDWCLRGKKRGYKTLVVPRAKGYHDVPRGKFTPRHIYYATRNRLIVAHRYALFSSLRQRPAWPWIWSRGVKIVFANDDLALTCAAAYWIGIWHYLRGHMGQCPTWMEGTVDDFLEARLRRKLRDTAIWKIARRLRQSLLST